MSKVETRFIHKGIEFGLHLFHEGD